MKLNSSLHSAGFRIDSKGEGCGGQRQRGSGARGVGSAGTLRAAWCAALIATCSQVSARSPQPRVESGTIKAAAHDGRNLRDKGCCGNIEMIDQDARILRIQRDGEAVPLTLVWNSQTRFIEGTGFVTAAALTKGARVTVSYHTPFFGKRFATKIVIERSAVRTPHSPMPGTKAKAEAIRKNAQ